VTVGVGSRRLALAYASKSKARVRAIARAKPKTARVAGGKPYGWGDGVHFSSRLKDSVFKCQAESSKIVRSEQPFFTIFRTPIYHLRSTAHPTHARPPRTRALVLTFIYLFIKINKKETLKGLFRNYRGDYLVISKLKII